MGDPYNATTDLLERNLSRRDRPALRQDGRLCRVSEDEESTEPQIICSMGLKKDEGGTL